MRIFQRTNLYLALLLTVISLGACDLKNTSAPLPSMVAYLTQKPWKIDSLIFVATQDTLRTLDVNGFANSSLTFTVGTTTALYNFRDIYDATLLGPVSSNIPTGDTLVFRYSTGQWGLNAGNDSLLYQPKDSTLIWGWKIEDTTHNKLVTSFVDTIYTATGNGQYQKSLYPKKIFLSRRN